MARVRTYSDLEKALNKAIDDCLTLSKMDIEQLGRETIQEVVYDPYQPKFYPRTYELKNSLEAVPVAKQQILVRHDLTKIKPGNAVLGVHQSPTTSKTQSKPNYGVAYNLPDIVHNGKAGSLFGGGFWRKPRPYMNKLEKKLSGKEGKAILKMNFQALGYEVK